MQLKGCILWLGMDAVFKALADESRRKLLDQLFLSNGQTLTELCTHLDMTRQAVTKHLQVLEEANLGAECVRTVAEGLLLTESRHFQVVLSQPNLPDGSWRQLREGGIHTGSEFLIILVAWKFDMRQWLQALKDGAFDVIDALHGLGALRDTVRRALWVEYLIGAGPAPEWNQSRESKK